MGTDIHGRLQLRYPHGNGQWIDAGEIEDDRNYTVFAILAGVRNGLGFAGVPTHTPISPISEPRGIPSDIGKMDDDHLETSQWTDEPKPYWLGDHSHSWLTVQEILDWPHWDSTIHRSGLVTKGQKAQMDKDGTTQPTEWCGGVWGKGSEDYVRIEWDSPIKDDAATFLAWVNYVHAKYGWLIEKDPANVRIVFGFDS